MKCPKCKTEIKKKYKEVKLEMILVVNSEDWEEHFSDDVDHAFESVLGGQQVEGIEGVAGVNELGTRDLDDVYDEFPLYDDGDVWKEWDKLETK